MNSLLRSGSILISTVYRLGYCDISLNHYSGTDTLPSLLCSLTLNRFVLFGSCLDLGKKIFRSMRYISKRCSRNRRNKQIICTNCFNWENNVLLQPPCLALPPTLEDVERTPCRSQTPHRKIFRPKQTAHFLNLTSSA